MDRECVEERERLWKIKSWQFLGLFFIIEIYWLVPILTLLVSIISSNNSFKGCVDYGLPHTDKLMNNDSI